MACTYLLIAMGSFSHHWYLSNIPWAPSFLSSMIRAPLLSWPCSLVFFMLFLWGPELLLAVCGFTWLHSSLFFFLSQIHVNSESKERELMSRVVNPRSKLGHSLVSWLASNFSPFPTLVLTSLNPWNPPIKHTASASI